MGGWAPIFAAGLLAGATLGARAQEASHCGAEPAVAGPVASVLDGRSFMLADGREIRLAGLQVPADTSLSGKAALERWLGTGPVTLRPAAGAPDRYGRTPAYVFTAGQSAHSATHEMIALGLARVSAHAGDAACAAELLALERTARAAGRGIWGEPRYAIMDAQNLAGLLAGQGGFAVVEGKVLSVRESGGTIYVNFGRRWSQALTVTISKRQGRMFSAAGVMPKALENRRVRVRGWLEMRNGPRIDASHPEQIEIAGLN